MKKRIWICENSRLDRFVGLGNDETEAREHCRNRYGFDDWPYAMELTRYLAMFPDRRKTTLEACREAVFDHALETLWRRVREEIRGEDEQARATMGVYKFLKANPPTVRKPKRKQYFYDEEETERELWNEFCRRLPKSETNEDEAWTEEEMEAVNRAEAEEAENLAIMREEAERAEEEEEVRWLRG